MRAGSLRVVEHGLGRAFFDDLAAGEDEDAVGRAAREAEFVCDDDERQPVPLEIFEHLQHIVFQFWIQRAGDFIAQQPRGSIAMARAIATRCFCPPDNSRG